MTAVYLMFRNWFFKGQKLYSNIHLFRLPFIYVTSVKQLDEAREGYILLDELWSFCDARMSKSKKNIFTANILARSRKRHLTYVSTSQVADALESRIRKVLDFTFYPVLNREETVMKVMVFRGGYVKQQHYMKTIYYRTAMMKLLYWTDEEVWMDDYDENAQAEIPKIIFQENYNEKHGFCCQCKDCRTVFFETWEEADKYANAYYQKNIENVKRML